MDANKLSKKFIQENFSPETTSAEAISFIAACPFKETAATLMIAYMQMIAIGHTPYEALQMLIEYFVEACNKLNMENGNEN